MKIGFAWFCPVVVLLVSSACSRQGNVQQAEAARVQTMQVVRGDVPVEIESFGILAASRNVDIKAQVSGKVSKIHFKEGSCVKKDELLISIDDEPYKANLRIDEAALLQDVEYCRYQKSVLQKDQKLYASGSMPKQSYEKMQSDITQLEAKLKSDQARIDLDKINLKYCSIASPLDGVIGYVKVDEGNVINSSDNAIANIKEIDPLYVDFNVPGKDLFRIRNALKERGEISVVISVPSRKNDSSEGEVTYKGTLKFLNNEVQNTSGTIRLRGIIPNPDMELLPGLYVNVKLVVGALKNATLIPEEGVVMDNGVHYFYTVTNDSRAKKTAVDVLGSHDNYYVAAENSGVKPGDNVIVTGLLNMTQNKKVLVNNPDLFPRLASNSGK